MTTQQKPTPSELRNQFWLENLTNGGGVVKSQYDEIKTVLTNQNIEWMENKYQEIKRHAIQQTEFYKNYQASDVFPVVNKIILAENRNAFMAQAGFSTPTHTSFTSGSTGIPFEILQDYRKRQRAIADLKVYGEKADYPSHECMVCFRSHVEKFHRTPEQEDRENIYYVDCLGLTEEKMNNMIKVVQQRQPRTILTYVNTIVEIAKYIKTALIDCVFPSLKSIITMSEGITDQDRQMVEQVFGCPVYRRYSNMEMGILGQDRGYGSSYELNCGSFYFECLKLDTDAPTANGEIGRIVVTDLFNKAFPLIRYDTGDLGIMERKANSFPSLNHIVGRKGDCLLAPNGRLIAVHDIGNTLWGLQNVKQYQIIQESQFLFVLKLVCSDGKIDNRYMDALKEILGKDAIIELRFVDEVPVLSSGKRRCCVCNYTPAKS